MFLVEPFSKMEMFNVERSSTPKSPRESVLAETDSYTHSTFRNLSIEGHIKVDSSDTAGSRAVESYLFSCLIVVRFAIPIL